jgi:hypothetical protein
MKWMILFVLVLLTACTPQCLVYNTSIINESASFCFANGYPVVVNNMSYMTYNYTCYYSADNFTRMDWGLSVYRAKALISSMR